MPAVLPPGLFMQTGSIAEGVTDLNCVQAEDIGRLWRIYALNKAHIGDDEGPRLENFFWRIWSNRNVIRSIRGDTLARLFMTISKGGNRVQTTPVQSLLATTPFPSATIPPAPTCQVQSAPGVPEQSNPIDTSPWPEKKAGKLPPRSPAQSQNLAPILKKARTGSGDLPKSAKILTAIETRHSPSAADTQREIPETVGGPSLSPIGAGQGSRHAARKKKGLAAPPNTRKSRPSLPKKRSSQSSIPGASRRIGQTSPSSPLLAAENSQKGELNPQGTASAVFAPLSSSWQDVDSQPSTSNSPDRSPRQSSSWLVDKDFRGKFVENQKRASSSVNLAGLARTQSVRFLDEPPIHTKPASEDNQTATEDEGKPRGETGTKSLDFDIPSVASSSAIEDVEEDGEMPAALPRTKSQLSMMIEKERKYSGDDAVLSPRAPPPGAARSERVSPPKTGEDDENNKLLMMARVEKKGQAKDPDLPFKAAAKKGFFLKGDGHGADDGPASPPLLF